MTVTDAAIEERHRRAAAGAYYQTVHGPVPRFVQQWIESGAWRQVSNAFLDRTAQSLANLEAAVRREYEARIAELEESLEMACQNPADGCDCPGCSYAAAVNSTELETLNNG